MTLWRSPRLQAAALLSLFACFSSAWLNERPVLEVHDGNLFVTSATDRNITLKTTGKSSWVNVNGMNILQIATSAENAAQLVERWKLGMLKDMQITLDRLKDNVEGKSGLLSRFASFEIGYGNVTSGGPGRFPVRPLPGPNRWNDAGLRNRVTRLTARVRQAEVQIANLKRKLETDECTSNPCQNGGTCEDLIDGYKCRCSEGWEGPQCATDINECSRYAGTDLGCQNGANCRNLPGTFQCICQNGWIGIHCAEKPDNCNSLNSREVCGHGVCVNKPGSTPGYTCICDAGWQTDGTIDHPACTTDVDECAKNQHPCSTNPMVQCMNYPGTFYCGPCPQGYTGNGYYCSDIDECATNNGGCSISPHVQCINTMGSRMCGSCPTGYQGDGVTCTYLGPCRIANGGCHPLATCINNAGMGDWYVQCRCPAGYTGNGMGSNGCVFQTDISTPSACSSSPCSHGTCVAIGSTDYSCRCQPGFMGKNCDTRSNPCEPNPCKNGGTCLSSVRQVAVCRCTANYSGRRCEMHRSSCGQTIRDPVGVVQFPLAGDAYPHGLSCAWVLVTNESMVLNVTFSAFNLELSTDCQYDFLQVHDGPTAGEHMIGRYCGNNLPQGGNIISSVHSLYLWFHSDNSINKDGFTFEWNSIPPLCGGEINEDEGTITSPGSPGRYPKDRDCTWHVNVTPGKRIKFFFSSMMLEDSPACSKDYLEIRNGPTNSSQQLGLYCNHTRPSQLVTPENEAWLHFHSDGSGQDIGFHITFTTEAHPGCGGVFTASSGIITSPDYHTDGYGSRLDCDWKIQAPQGERIQITWTDFEVEGSHSCIFDYVQVFDGGSREAPLLGRYCGSTLPANILSQSNVLLIRFRSDWSYNGRGFRLNYKIFCGGEFTEETGVLKSPYYPNPYPASRICIYKIMQPLGKAIRLTIQDMDIEGWDSSNCYFDRLEIHDGQNENYTTIGTYCGTNASIPEFPIMSTYNYLWIKFETDNSVHNRGFMATYTTVDRGCGGILHDRSGIIQSPSEDGKYRNGEDCTWIIQAPPGFVIQLNWLSFDIEQHSRCRFDYVKISENITRDLQQDMGTYCGSTKPPLMTTQSQLMSIHFHTDSSWTRDGFMASYIFVDASKVCGGHFSTLTGVIKSPNYPDHYPTHRDCEWVITAPNRHQVTLNVKKFDLERAYSVCTYDTLEIRNGGTTTSPLMGKYCGTEIPSTIKSFGNQMYLKFKSDGSRSGEGFMIEWDSNTVGCGGTLTSTSGSISSPNYPQPYHDRAECIWHIRVAAGSKIQFAIVDLELEEHSRCHFDYIEIFDGPVARGQSRGRYCGAEHPLVVNSTSNIASVRFRSDWTGSGRGFLMNYQALCQNKVTGFRGVIESPNFPEKYPHRANCSWIVEAPIGNRLNLTFSHFDLEGGSDSCRYDYLEIKEGNHDAPNKNINKYCDSMALPPKIVSNERQVFLNFRTDSYTAGTGFRVEWAVNGCGGLLVKPEGTITSPGYPHSYPTEIVCEWNIEVDYLHSINITLEDVDLEKTQDCHFDKITIYLGSDDTAPKLIETCQVSGPRVITSTSNKVFIRFKADASFQGRGFKLTYKTVDITCGGRFTTATGLIHSANYPQNYPAHEYCEWLIQVPPNYLVNLTFSDFGLENTRNCSDDYVRIYDGPTIENSPVLGFHCGNQLPPSYVSTTNELLVIMRSDEYIGAKGFKATYDLACGAKIMTNDQGILQMDPAVGLHTNIVNCTWTIIAENPEDHVTLAFTDMQLRLMVSDDNECSESSITVFEGDGIDGSSLGNWCGNTVPPPIVSTGNALTVHATSMYRSLYDAKFAASYSVLNSACGGNYTAEHGRIASPGYPNNYPQNVECVWYLRTSPGNSISVTFAEFELVQSESCNLDYVEVREEDGAGKLIGVFCGQSTNPITSRKSLWMKFKSSADETKRGFVADYSLIHGNELAGRSGDIASPLYPQPCRLDGEYYWRVVVDVGSAIQITFKDFHVERYSEECYISLTIYDGYNAEAPELISACGHLLPETKYSTSNVVYIKFYTMPMREGSWFLLNWLQVPRDSGNSGGDSGLSSGCDQTIALTDPTKDNHTFNSPGWPTGYENNLNCNWIFESIPGTHLVMKFDNLNLEESYRCIMDQVRVFTGHSPNSRREWTQIGTYCLPNATSEDIIIPTNLLKVTFHSDVSFSKTGFNATVRRVCGGQLSGPNGIIEFNSSTITHGSRRWYPSQCEWNVTVRSGRTIEVTFIALDIPSTTPNACGDHYLMLKNGGSEESPLLGTGKYCGSDDVAPLQTTGNQLHVKVFGQQMSTRFKIAYREMGTNCGNQIILTESLKSWNVNTPNFPNIPPLHTECIWTIMAPAGEQISIHFGSFYLATAPGCSQEYLEIRDGATESSALMGRYCKAEVPSSMSTTGNTMYLHFYTDTPTPNNGFNATVVMGDTCGGVIRGTRGTVKSPNYPAAYPSNVTCQWYIVGPPGHTLKLQIRDIDFPSRVYCENGDYVGIAERVLSNTTEYSHSSMNEISNFEVEDIGKYCGREPPPVIETSGNTAVVTFRSTRRDDIRNRGFRLNFTSSLEKCGGPLTASTGEFTTPGYPTMMPGHNRYCVWNIVAPEGYRIQLDLIDFDLGDVSASRGGRMTPRMAFYNDFGWESYIGDIRPTDTKRQMLSTSNKMTVYYWSGSGSHRGIKARYTQVVPALCGSRTTNDRGTLMSQDNSIFNLTSFSCNWKVQSPTMNTTTQTLAVTVSGIIGSTSSALRYPCVNSVANVLVYGESSHMISCVSGNLTKPIIVRSPLPVHMITASKGRWRSPVVNFGLSYRWHQCGGVLGGPSHTISTPVSTSYPIDCAWHAKFPDSGEIIELTFSKIDLKCDDNYIIIRNGGPLAPQIGSYCGSISPLKIVSQSNQLWIEFHGELSNGTFELKLETRQDGCGGLIQGRRSADISSPGFPDGNYPDKAECMWEIEVEHGYHIGLVFLDRFNLESSTGCSNDFVQVFDWREDRTTGLSSWVDLGKACGRNTPSPFNSTSHRMKVLFRSNDGIKGDGFRARWNENCGGVIPVYKETQYLTSPGFPLRYRGGLSCNYTFLAPGKNFILEFTDFQLEDGTTSGCRYDNVSISSNEWETDPPMWCGESGPPPQRVASRSEVIFKTDPYGNRRGFRIKYHLDECGGEINTPSEIKSPSIDANGHYYSRINCTWVVRAPPGKSAIVKFESFHLEYSIRCQFDYLAIYSGVTINTDNRLALLCGSLNETLDHIKSENGSMIINFVTDQSFNFGGFSANIEFTTSCGGKIVLSSSQTFRTQSGSTYDSLEDCHWLVKAPSSNVVKLTMTSVDLKNSTSALRNEQCAGDYIEVRDGGGPFSELIGKYCGNVVPSPITSSSNVLWIRFVSDATLNGNGVVARLENIPSVCGQSILTVDNTTKILTSPNYPSNYGPGLRCRWSLTDANPRIRDRYTIHFVQFDLENSEKCASDVLSISDRNTRNFISEGLGQELIFSGTPERPRTMWMGSHIPHETYSYCGSAVPHDYYSMGNQVEIQFKSSEQSSGQHVGFKLEYGMGTCNRNFTGEQGRISHHDVKDCWFTITAPVGHTISLYFNEFISFDHSGCTNSALQIFDGNFNNNTLVTLCGYTVPNPVFSTGNKLSFHSWSRGSHMYKGYDMTYMTTDKGRGCGGKLYNYGGQFTSPLYPGSYRNESECIWEVSVPTGFNIKLQFEVFDLGRRSCASDYIQFVDVQPSGDNLSPTQFCGEDEPAVYHSTTGKVLVKYHTSVNNGGTGWVIDFTAEHNNRG